MGSTVIINMRSVVHAGSGGTAPSLPDVCKTPAPPGPPIPVPYPNISTSSDAAEGSKAVKCDSKPIMLKKSQFKTSTGDEAGTLKGIVSGTTKGVSKFANYSFDVKVEGQNVPRLADPMTTNGNAPNSANMAELQANLGLTNAIMTAKELRYLCKIVCREAKKPGARSNRANAVLKKQTSYPRIKPEQPFPGCRPDFTIQSGGEILIVGDFKWKASRDRFRGDQLKNMMKIKRKHKKIIMLNEELCQC